MTKVSFFGKLGEVIGRRHWLVEVRSPAEAIRAVEANTGKLIRYLMGDGAEGYYRVIVNGKDFQAQEELTTPMQHYRTIAFVPVLAGASDWASIGMAILGAVLIVISFIPGIGTALSPILFSLGVGLLLGGVVGLLSTQPGIDTKESKKSPSYLFSGAVNTTSQGYPVPVGYGELIVGSAVISYGVTTKEIAV